MKLCISENLSRSSKAVLPLEKDNDCLFDKFFEEEKKKPLLQRRNYAMISCRCRRCNPATL